MIQLYEFHRSPNSAKVRIALNYKGIPFEMREMSASDRTPMIEAANWPLVPVIIDGEVRMRDSEAILHYLESNYRDLPSLTPPSIEAIRRGDAIRAEIEPLLRPIARRAYGEATKKEEDRDPRAAAALQGQLETVLSHLEDALGKAPFLTGEQMTTYDILAAAPLRMARAPAEYAAQSPIWAYFRERFSIPAKFSRVNEWLDRVLAYDSAEVGAAT